MKNLLLLFSAILIFSTRIIAQGICNPAGNLIIYSNYDGGEITINIDEDIPDIKIGICSYEGVQVTIAGTYGSNVTEVLYAGYNNGGTTSIIGVDPGIVEILNYPPATLFDADGNVNMVCAYECDTTFIPGGCNTVDQATHYFLTELGGGIRYGYFQYGSWSGSYMMSAGGNCCVDAACSIIISAGQDKSICIGDSVELLGEGAINYSWFPLGTLSDPLIANPVASPLVTTTYYLTGTDADGCSGIDTVTVTVYPLPEPLVSVDNDTLYASGGTGYQWLLNGEIIPGANDDIYVIEESGDYSVVVTSAEGCEQTSISISMVINNLNDPANNITIGIFPNPAKDELNIDIGEITENINLIIYNSAGQEMKQLKMVGEQQVTIPLSKMPAGVYLIQFINEEINVFKQVIILH